MTAMRIIYGQVPSKSNGYRIITIHGHGSLAKTKELKEYEKNFALQYKRHPKILGNFELVVNVYFRSNRSDLDGMFKVVLDCLQSVEAIDNDRYCMKIIATKRVDKDNPRVEIMLNQIQDATEN
jgi:Holliday junction resolvase RusA-like endonuclease